MDSAPPCARRAPTCPVQILLVGRGLADGARRRVGLGSFRLDTAFEPAMENPPPGRGEDAVEPGEKSLGSRSRLAERSSSVSAQPTRGVGWPVVGVHPGSVADGSDRVDLTLRSARSRAGRTGIRGRIGQGLGLPEPGRHATVRVQTNRTEVPGPTPSKGGQAESTLLRSVVFVPFACQILKQAMVASGSQR